MHTRKRQLIKIIYKPVLKITNLKNACQELGLQNFSLLTEIEGITILLLSVEDVLLTKP